MAHRGMARMLPSQPVKKQPLEQEQARLRARRGKQALAQFASPAAPQRLERHMVIAQLVDRQIDKGEQAAGLKWAPMTAVGCRVSSTK
jgi:hypothetical protein